MLNTANRGRPKSPGWTVRQFLYFPGVSDRLFVGCQWADPSLGQTARPRVCQRPGKDYETPGSAASHPIFTRGVADPALATLWRPINKKPNHRCQRHFIKGLGWTFFRIQQSVAFSWQNWIQFQTKFNRWHIIRRRFLSSSTLNRPTRADVTPLDSWFRILCRAFWFHFDPGVRSAVNSR